MSIDVDWSRISPEDNARISETVRDFLDRQFKKLHLPSYIASVDVLAFDIGTVAPEIDIRHIGDPYPEFYEDDEDSTLLMQQQVQQRQAQQRVRQNSQEGPSKPTNGAYSSSSSASSSTSNIRMRPQAFSSAPGAANLQYFHAVLTPSLIPGLRSPLQNSFQNLPGIAASLSRRNSDGDDSESASYDRPPPDPDTLGHDEVDGPSDADDQERVEATSSPDVDSQPGPSSEPNRMGAASPTPSQSQPPPFYSRDEDVQLLLRVKYKGDLRIVLTATLRLNYPAPEFLTLPVRLTVTGFDIDAMAVLTYITRRIHFSFISDVGGGSSSSGDAEPMHQHFEVLRNIKVESEIGDQVGKGAVLKNVGKVERFVLERLRAIVRDEIAWPGWITFEF
ncbi:hypothetical protein V1525DRAFT_400595 [Lipomyces kononenkoae]|uniref:Uncharacterized protein n=1 Tax=Lipomyces kononenkoae TaxID=34357 RepID=A0ACC3T5C5_LIPKO